MQKIIPFLWFDHQAEEAVDLYTSVFKDSKKGKVTRYGPGQMGQEGKVMTAQFWLSGQEFTALNGGPHYSFTPAISFVVSCKDQSEVDYYWEKLGEEGKYEQCGWLTDRFGVSWQIVPEELPKLISGQNPEKSSRAVDAMMKMIKLDIDKLKEAYEGVSGSKNI